MPKNKLVEYNFEHYDKRLISVFDVIGSYFVDVLFNHIYNASKMHVAGESSITDEFKRNIQVYIIEVKNNHTSYTKTLNELHKYFTACTSYKTISFTKFVDNIVELVMPEEYFDSLNNSEKDEVLGSTICDLISGLGVYATSPDMLSRIIDHHDSQHEITIKMLQQYSITLLIAKRDSIYNKFLKNIGQAKETVSIDIVENMRKVIRRLVKDKSELIARITKLEKKLDGSSTDHMQYKKVEAKLRRRIEELEEALEDLQEDSSEESESESESEHERRKHKKKVKKDTKKKKKKTRGQSVEEKPDNIQTNDNEISSGLEQAEALSEAPTSKISKIDKDKFKEARQKLIQKRNSKNPDGSSDSEEERSSDTGSNASDGSAASDVSMESADLSLIEHLKRK
jgi:hypothetical protein